MFSNSVELILSIAYREATARRHTHLTLEHLLYVLAHDAEGEKILNACGADLPALRSELNKYLSEKVEQFPHGRQQEPEQTLAFRRTLQTAVLHVQSASRPEVQAGDLLAAMLQQHKSFASQLLEGQGVTRLDILNFISHGIAKVPPILSDRSPSSPASDGDAPSGQGEEGKASARDPLVAYTINLSARAAAGELDPLIGRNHELQRTMEVLCRRRKNNPVFVGEAGVGKTALAEGLAQRLLQDDVPAILRAPKSSRSTPPRCSPGRASAATSRSASRPSSPRWPSAAKPILFIDEVHSTVGAGATTGGTMDLATLIKPVLTAGELRVVGSTTFEEFKQIEKDRGLARRLQKIAVDEPSVDETVRILKGLRSALRAAPQRALHGRRARRRRQARRAAPARLRLPDSAIDILDEAGAMLRLQPEQRRRRRPRASTSRSSASPTAKHARRSSAAAHRRRRRDREGRRAHRAHPREAGVVVGQGAPAGRSRSRCKRVVFGQDDAVHTVATSIKRARAGLGQPDKPAGCFLFTGPTGVGKTELAKQLARHLGNEFTRFDMSRIHGEARRRPPDRRASRLRRLRAGRPAGRRRSAQHPYSVLLLDEIEKAHPDIFNILLQVMDHATLTDNNGRKADFRQVVLIMTSQRRLARDERRHARLRRRAGTEDARQARSPRAAARKQSSACSARSSATASTPSSPSTR